MPSVFQYTDYRRFLRDAYEEKKARSRAFSQRYIASKVGFKSAGHFSQILSGKLNISIIFVEKLAVLFKLTKRQAQYFQNLVLFNQARAHQDKKHYFEKMVSFREAAVRNVEASQYEYYDKWYNSIIRAILEFHTFRGEDYATLARMVVPSITPNEAQRSIELMDRLGLIARDNDNRYRPTDKVIHAAPQTRNVSIDSFVLNTLNLAREAIDRFPRDQRRFSCITLGISRKGYEEVVQELHDFQRRVYTIAEHDRADSVYQFNMQIFPVAREPQHKGGKQ